MDNKYSSGPHGGAHFTRKKYQRIISCTSKPSCGVSYTTKGPSPVPELKFPLITNKSQDILNMWGRYCDREFEENVSFYLQKTEEKFVFNFSKQNR